MLGAQCCCAHTQYSASRDGRPYSYTTMHPTSVVRRPWRCLAVHMSSKPGWCTATLFVIEACTKDPQMVVGVQQVEMFIDFWSKHMHMASTIQLADLQACRGGTSARSRKRATISGAGLWRGANRDSRACGCEASSQDQYSKSKLPDTRHHIRGDGLCAHIPWNGTTKFAGGRQRI